jgi:hypothetical protein
MKHIGLLLLVAAFAGCVGAENKVKQATAGATRLKLTLRNTNSDSTARSYMITDAKQIEQMAGYMSGDTTPAFKCGYDGQLEFQSETSSLFSADFIVNDVGCMHFSYMMDGQAKKTVLSPEAQMFIQSLQKEK